MQKNHVTLLALSSPQVSYQSNYNIWYILQFPQQKPPHNWFLPASLTIRVHAIKILWVSAKMPDSTTLLPPLPLLRHYLVIPSSYPAPVTREVTSALQRLLFPGADLLETSCPVTENNLVYLFYTQYILCNHNLYPWESDPWALHLCGSKCFCMGRFSANWSTRGSPSTRASTSKIYLGDSQRDAFKMGVRAVFLFCEVLQSLPHHPQRNRSFQKVGLVYRLSNASWLYAHDLLLPLAPGLLLFLECKLGSHLMSCWPKPLPGYCSSKHPHNDYTSVTTFSSVFQGNVLLCRGLPCSNLETRSTSNLTLSPVCLIPCYHHLLIFVHPLSLSFVCLLFSLQQMSALKGRNFFFVLSAHPHTWNRSPLIVGIQSLFAEWMNNTGCSAICLTSSCD